MNKTVRMELLTVALLASFAGLAASPATGDDQVRPAAPVSDESDDPSAVSADRRGHRPPPPPSLATFTGVVAVGRTRFSYTMVGTNPLLRRAQNVVVPMAIIPLRLEFPNGTVMDPTAPDACLGGRVPLAVTLQSPLFQDFDYGEGPRQFNEQVRRLEFWQLTGPHKLNPGYSVRLSVPKVLPTQTLVLSAASTTEDVLCHATGGTQKFGHIEGDDYGNFLQNQVVPQFPKWGVDASTFVLVMLPFADFTANGVETGFAYHGLFFTPQGMVTYAAAQLGNAYPGNVVNIGPMSHEFAEWMDDPYGNNTTPPWGNTGQVTVGCANDLEVADPLTGTFLPPIKMPNGISYQPQETAFFSWFFDQVPSIGFNGWYSSGGTFKEPAAACH